VPATASTPGNDPLTTLSGLAKVFYPAFARQASSAAVTTKAEPTERDIPVHGGETDDLRIFPYPMLTIFFHVFFNVSHGSAAETAGTSGFWVSP